MDPVVMIWVEGFDHPYGIQKEVAGGEYQDNTPRTVPVAIQ